MWRSSKGVVSNSVVVISWVVVVVVVVAVVVEDVAEPVLVVEGTEEVVGFDADVVFTVPVVVPVTFVCFVVVV